MMPSPSRQEAYEKIARAARLGASASGGDPDSVILKFILWVEAGCVGSLDEALGASPKAPVDYEKRDRLMRRLFALHKAGPNQVMAAYRSLSNYREKWQSRRSIENGGHEAGTPEHLCWRIFNSDPELFDVFITARRFRQIVKGN